MIASDPALGKFGITARLFKLVSDMPKDKQLLLLKQLIGDRVSAHLYKLIVEMNEEQQIILLEQMGQLPPAELPVRTVSLEETESSMRENPRKPCLINTNYRIQNRNYKSYLLDISIGGVFIEADTRFPVGQELLLKFSLPNRPQPFTFSGKIAWSSAKGFGVQFNKISETQSDILKSFVEQDK
jgi:Tfp pilus assembly protein PilZ